MRHGMWLVFSWSLGNNQRKHTPFPGVLLMLGVSSEVGCPHQHPYLHQQGATLQALLYFTWTHWVNVDQQATAWTSAFITDPLTFSIHSDLESFYPSVPSTHLWVPLHGDPVNTGGPKRLWQEEFHASKFIRCHLSGTWHLAWSFLRVAELCSGISALAFKRIRLVLPFAKRPLQIREKEVCRKLETVSLSTANTPNQGCEEYTRPWL